MTPQEEIKLECLRQANSAVSTTRSLSSMGMGHNSSPTEVLNTAKSFYSWVTGEDGAKTSGPVLGTFIPHVSV